uniref:Uncharacterized protein n=1 Tax=Oryza punctata TaxID=4537 RepID=A0A0E0KUG4_ORYPU
MRERHRAEARGGKGTKSGWPGETRAERHRTASHPSRRRGRRRPPAPAPAPASCNLQAVTVQVNRSGPAVRIAARVGLRFSEGACRLQMRGLVSACYNQMLSDGIPEQEARRRLDYYG